VQEREVRALPLLSYKNIARSSSEQARSFVDLAVCGGGGRSIFLPFTESYQASIAIIQKATLSFSLLMNSIAGPEKGETYETVNLPSALSVAHSHLACSRTGHFADA
jgi:hypothetical protein